MSQVHFEITDKKGIEALGFEYAKTLDHCRGHMFNAIPVEIDLRDKPEYSLTECEEDLDKIFRSVLKWELQDAGIKTLHEVKWTRIFFFNNWWEPRDFIAKFWVRIVGEDAENFCDGHKIRA